MESSPSLDLASLDNVCAGNLTLRQAVLTEYLKVAPKSMSEMNSHLDRGELMEARRSAHSLKGGSRTIGAVRMGDLCSRLESCKLEEEMFACLSQLKEEFAVVEDSIRQVLGSEAG
jgi:HPt (histidine-containing phosphotransfer) domain-containing protein